MKNSRIKNGIMRIVQGIIIGAGAILPGISGGVLAVVFGIYRPAMELLTHPRRALQRYWRMLLAVGIGWAIGFLFCGVLWGFSFIIPGMTSSSILMAVGLLTPLIDGIAQLDFTVLVPWGLGMVGVMALFARIVSRLFDTHYSIACHAVIGIVLASTLIIIPTDFASTAEMVWSVACAILGAVLAYFGSKLQPQEDAEIEAK